MKDCIFCMIVKGKIPSFRVYEDEHTIAFAPLKEAIITKRQLLIIPKNHFENIFDLPIDESSHIIEAIKKIAQKLREKYKAEGINLIHASGKVAQQTVFHFHIHILPRYSDDGLDAWPRTGYDETEYPGIYEKMKDLME